MKSLNKSIRWGIIGCGDVTEIKSGPPYQQIPGFELKAVMRRTLSKAKDYASRHGVEEYYDDAKALIDHPEIDAIYIATPPDSHHQYALQVAEAGKICCIEKPLAPSYAQSTAIVEAFETRNIPLFVAYYRRTLPRFVQLKKWLDDNEIGEVRHINWNLSSPPSEVDLSKSYNWRTDVKVAPGGYFDDLASHGLDLFVYLLGDISEIQGISLNQQGLYEAKDAITACWLHQNGITGTGSWNFGTASREEQVHIYGSKGKITFSVFAEDAPIVLDTEEGKHELSVAHPRHIQHHHVAAMQEQLLTGKLHPSTGMTAAHTSWVMDKVLGKI